MNPLKKEQSEQDSVGIMTITALIDNNQLLKLSLKTLKIILKSHINIILIMRFLVY